MPIASGSLDVVLNAHMLYHVADISSAIAEFRCVLRPGGHLLAIYDSIRSQSELDQLFLDAGGTRTLNQIETRFSLENGHEFLDPWFDSVRLHAFGGEMVVTEAHPVIDALDLSHEVAEPYPKPGIAWSQ
jgi:ubiquinone/menaquinone biosynthesis C-methylase UbiE